MAITLTEKAAQRVKTYLARQHDTVGLRLGVRKSGCSGWAYVVEYAQAIEPEDQVFVDHEVRLVIARKNLPFLDGMEVDFVREGLNESFKFNNPNVKSQCGCGESFGV